MWYGKTRVTSWKLKSTSWNSKVRVQIIHELRVQIHAYEFESTSYESQFTGYEFKSPNH